LTLFVWLALLRITVGLSWLLAGIANISDPNYATRTIAPTLLRWSSLWHGPVQTFLGDTLSANLGLLAFLVKIVELVIGASLLLGFLGRLAALTGFLVITAAWLAKHSFDHLGGYGSSEFIVMATLLFLALTRSDRYWGIDAVRGRRAAKTSNTPSPAPGGPHAAGPAGEYDPKAG
jgi:uncharacterized membrane protein YphA (DoxX/SURF4 family)